MTTATHERITPPPENGTATEKSDFEKLMDRPFMARPPHEVLAENLGLPVKGICGALKQSIMPRDTSESDFYAFLHVCAKYRLNPFTKEIYPMPKKGGGIQNIVGIDGWVAIVQREKRFDGVTFEYVVDDDGKLEMIWCTMYVKGQTHPVKVPERLAECRRNTDPWNQMPYRMLRHKAYIQAARIAFGINGIMDEEEGRTAAGYAPEENVPDAPPAKKPSISDFAIDAPAEPAPEETVQQGGAGAGNSADNTAPAPPAVAEQPAPSDAPLTPREENLNFIEQAKVHDPKTVGEVKALIVGTRKRIEDATDSQISAIAARVREKMDAQ